MLYLPITRGWLFSLTAQRIYFASAVLALALIATLVGVHMAMTAAGTRSLIPPASSVVRILLYPEVVGAAVLWVAMWYFWFAFDSSHYLKRAAWFLMLFLLAPFGPVLYYFFVYRRRISVQAEPQPTETAKDL
jgi:hypothetical protein